MEDETRLCYLFMANQEIEDYVAVFGNNVADGTETNASFIVGTNLQTPTKVPIYDFMTFEQLRRHKDELAILHLEACIPTKGIFRRFVDSLVECVHAPSKEQDIMISPTRMFDHCIVKQSLLPSQGILQTFLEIARAHALPHRGSEEPLLFGRHKMGVLVKIEFLRHASINSTRRGIGGDLPWQEQL